MKLCWSSRGWLDYLHWQQVDWHQVEKINALIKDAMRSPFTGLGKPEPLRGEMQGLWSRRISSEHRFIYRVTGKGEDQILEVLFCRFHYVYPDRKK
ncbi:Txe/YoeB family addiction module toxin [Rhizobium sp.]